MNFQKSAAAHNCKLKCKPRLYELDLIRRNGKTVRVINRAAATWERVAIRLYFKGHEIKSIERNKHFQTGNACRAIFIEWLEGKGRQPTTWETLIEALEEADLSELASDLKDTLEAVVHTKTYRRHTI